MAAHDPAPQAVPAVETPPAGAPRCRRLFHAIQVDSSRSRLVDDSPPGTPEAQAEVHVAVDQEETVVHAAYLLKGVAAHHHRHR
jgi:hypothetical protein